MGTLTVAGHQRFKSRTVSWLDWAPYTRLKTRRKSSRSACGPHCAVRDWPRSYSLQEMMNRRPATELHFLDFHRAGTIEQAGTLSGGAIFNRSTEINNPWKQPMPVGACATFIEIFQPG